MSKPESQECYDGQHEACLEPAYCECWCHGGSDAPVVVKGNRLRITRLDPEGRPLGEPIDVAGGYISFPETELGEVTVDEDVMPPLKRTTVEVTFKHIDLDALGLLYGVALPPRPWWWKFTPRFIKHKIKRREIRRGYGG